jgi:hypothetical protein
MNNYKVVGYNRKTLTKKEMYSAKSYQLEREEYNYLLPVLKSKLLSRGDRFYFIGSFEDLSDMLHRLKGLYDNYDESKSMLSYNCFKESSLMPFRNEINLN